MSSSVFNSKWIALNNLLRTVCQYLILNVNSFYTLICTQLLINLIWKVSVLFFFFLRKYYCNIFIIMLQLCTHARSITVFSNLYYLLTQKWEVDSSSSKPKGEKLNRFLHWHTGFSREAHCINRYFVTFPIHVTKSGASMGILWCIVSYLSISQLRVAHARCRHG